MRIACVACALLAACGFHAGGKASDGGDDDDGSGHDLVDTFTMGGTFTDGEGQLTDAGLEPDLLFPGGFHALAYTGDAFDDGATWATITAAPSAQLRGEALAVMPTNYETDPDATTDVPNGLGLGATATDAFQLVMDGELKLTGGAAPLMFDTECDDRCFIQLAKTPGPVGPDTEWFDPMNHANESGPVSFQIDESGWYAIRFAYEDTGGQAHWQFAIDGTAVAPQNVRVRGRALNGLVAKAFAHPGFIRPKPVQPLTGFDARDGTPGVGPFDLDPTYVAPSSAPMYSLRWVGQLHADGVAKQTVFRMDTGQGNGTPVNPYRIWLDHAIIADTIGAGASTSRPTDLAAGWHDVMVEVSVRQSPPTRIQFLWTSQGQSQAPVPRSVLRPAWNALTATYETATPMTAIMNMPVPVTPSFMPAPPSGTVVDTVDFSLATSTGGALPSGSSASVSTCGMSPAWTLVAAVLPNWYYAGGVACGAMPAASAAPMATVTAGLGGSGFYAFASEVYRGGTASGPFATAFTYESAAFATPQASAFGKVHVDGDFDNATLAISVRTAADSASLDAAAWKAVDNDAVPDLMPQAYVQYQLVVASDGWHDPIVRKVTLTFTTK
ncbi:MAG TPA: hypothetical protein VGM88_28570 [Kofleriaceae bacterium]|jgi:hypothetical protein